MASLPAQGWNDLVAKQGLRLELENVEHRLLTAVHREFTVQTRIYVLAIIFTVIASSVAVFTS